MDIENEREFEVWNTFKSIELYMGILMARNPHIVRHLVKSTTQEKSGVFELTSEDTRHYLFQDAQSRDHYDRLYLDGKNQTITFIENNEMTVINRDMLIMSTNLDSLDKISAFTERMVKKYELTKQQNKLNHKEHQKQQEPELKKLKNKEQGEVILNVQ